MRKGAEHFGIPWPRYRLIGVLEAAAAVGAAAGIIWRPIGLASGFGVVALMLGALFFHIRAGDKAVACAGAVVVLLAAAGYLYAGCNRPSSSQASACHNPGDSRASRVVDRGRLHVVLDRARTLAANSSARMPGTLAPSSTSATGGR